MLSLVTGIYIDNIYIYIWNSLSTLENVIRISTAGVRIGARALVESFRTNIVDLKAPKLETSIHEYCILFENQNDPIRYLLEKVLFMVQNQGDFTNFERDDVPCGLHYACASTIGILSILVSFCGHVKCAFDWKEAEEASTSRLNM